MSSGGTLASTRADVLAVTDGAGRRVTVETKRRSGVWRVQPSCTGGVVHWRPGPVGQDSEGRRGCPSLLY